MFTPILTIHYMLPHLGGPIDTEESLDEEIGEEVDEVDSPPKVAHKNRK